MTRERSILANNLKVARDLKGWTQKDLSTHSGINKPVIERLEASVVLDPRISTIQALAYALKIPIDYLVN